VLPWCDEKVFPDAMMFSVGKPAMPNQSQSSMPAQSLHARFWSTPSYSSKVEGAHPTSFPLARLS
jgi:hypothetical protein